MKDKRDEHEPQGPKESEQPKPQPAPKPQPQDDPLDPGHVDPPGKGGGG